MRLFGVTTHEFFKTGFLAVIFILLFKWAVPRLNVPALTATAGAI